MIWKLLFGEGDLFLCAKWILFSLPVMGGNKQDERRGNYRVGIILRDNFARHCFELQGLIPMNFFK